MIRIAVVPQEQPTRVYYIDWHDFHTGCPTELGRVNGENASNGDIAALLRSVLAHERYTVVMTSSVSQPASIQEVLPPGEVTMYGEVGFSPERSDGPAIIRDLIVALSK